MKNFLKLSIFLLMFASSSALASNTVSSDISLKNVKRFAAALSQIKHYYIYKLEDKTLFENAIKGLLSNLDPHSAYLDKNALQDIQTATTGKFGGIGIEVIPYERFIEVITPIEDSPADRAGIKSGDLIVQIDKKLVKDMSLDEAIGMMRGKAGTHVLLTIIRKKEKKPLRFNITRAIINVQTVKSRLLEPGYGYLRISIFQHPVKKNLIQAIAQLKAESDGTLKGIVLDLRNNPGGLLESAGDVADSFLDAKKLKKNTLIVYTKGRTSNATLKIHAKAGELLPQIPMVVLINRGSASAAEIVAGALQDHKRALIVGERSFGKGSVQTVLPIDDETAMKLTTALYYTPLGRSIQANGIVPDIAVKPLKIEESNEEDILKPLYEADLKDHIANDQAAQSSVRIAKKENKLAHSDFQLYQALQVLKGLATAKGAVAR